MPTLTVDGTPLYYRDEGQGLPVLLLHAFPLHSGAFDKQVQALSGRYRFLLPDLRGFGRSVTRPGPSEAGSEAAATSMTTFARDALALLDALEIDSAVVGGVSMGGYASMALLREDAGRVRGLVLVDTQALADDAEGRAKREGTAQGLLKEGPELLVRTMLPRLVAAGADSQVGREVAAMIRTGSAEGLAAAQRGMALRHDSKDILARYAGPTLVVVGEKDPITPPEKARQLAELVTGARLEVIPGAAHLSNQEQPERFNTVLEQFLSGI